MYRPSVPVIVSRDSPVATSTALTVAPGTTPPVLSVIAPLIWPVWASAGLATSTARHVAPRTNSPCRIQASSRNGRWDGESYIVYGRRASGITTCGRRCKEADRDRERSKKGPAAAHCGALRRDCECATDSSPGHQHNGGSS